MPGRATIVRKREGRALLEANMDTLSGSTLRVGVMGEGGGPAPKYEPPQGQTGPDVDLATLLAWHEFGLVPGVPARPVLRTWATAERRRITEAVQAVAKAAASGRRFDETVQRVGEKLAASLRRHLLRGVAPPLAPSTLERVAPRTAPLATDQILRAIRWAIEEDRGT